MCISISLSSQCLRILAYRHITLLASISNTPTRYASFIRSIVSVFSKMRCPVVFSLPPAFFFFFFFQAEDGIRDSSVTGVQTCALPISFLPIPTLSSLSLQLPTHSFIFRIISIRCPPSTFPTLCQKPGGTPTLVTPDRKSVV